MLYFCQCTTYQTLLIWFRSDSERVPNKVLEMSLIQLASPLLHLCFPKSLCKIAIFEVNLLYLPLTNPNACLGVHNVPL